LHVVTFYSAEALASFTVDRTFYLSYFSNSNKSLIFTTINKRFRFNALLNYIANRQTDISNNNTMRLHDDDDDDDDDNGVCTH